MSLGAATIAVYDYGPPPGESLGDVLLLHGMADVARSLEPLARSLVNRYRVVAFDARGHGRSDHPGAYSVLHFVADLIDLIDTLEIDQPILIGHSLGGHTVANYSGLYSGRVRAAVLLEGMGPPGAPEPAVGPHHLDQARGMVEVLRSSPRHRPQPNVQAAADRLTAAHPRLDPGRARLLADEGTIPTEDGGRVWRHDERTWDWIASLDQSQLQQRWAAITAPVLAVSGAEAWETWWTRRSLDRVKMTDHEFTARLALIADIEHHELPEAGHMIHFDRPDRINELIADFLDRRVVRG